MSLMLPAISPSEPRLADVLTSCIQALDQSPNALGLPSATRVIVVVVDGLGAHNLRARLGHARTLREYVSKKSIITSGFPSTTASALTSLTTGALPGETGMVGYSVFSPSSKRVLNQISGWGREQDPARWQRSTTHFERQAQLGRASATVGPARYKDSGFTQAILRGATYLSAESMVDRVQASVDALASNDIVYVYIPELDMAGHAEGWESDRWLIALEELDQAMNVLLAAIPRGCGVILTADHGMVDISSRSHRDFGATDHRLVEGIAHFAGEPRCLQLHFDEELTATERTTLSERWKQSESEYAWVFTRDEAIDSGWFGVVSDEVSPRMGDLFVAARKNIAYYDYRDPHAGSRNMVGQHGSLTAAEIMVPLLRMGAFAPR